jgi:hypothetical protein
MRGPAITLRCDCGAEGQAAYAERWSCPNCGRVYETSRIPESDYAAVAALDRRYRITGFAIVAVLATIVLAVALTGQLISIFAGLAVAMLSWFLFIKPIVHRRHRRAVGALTRRWELNAE